MNRKTRGAMFFKGFGNDGVFLERLMYRVIIFNTMGLEDISSFSG